MDYKTDYVLMAAETYTLDHNPAAATHRLANLESGSALEILRQAILYAEQAGYIDQDLQKLHNLQSALSAAASPTAVPAP